MDISVNVKDGVPLYRQIANQIRYMVASGLLQPGEEVMAVRTLALKLLVTPNTVVKAYDELERDGVITRRRGSGTYVADLKTPLANRERNRIIEQRVDALLTEAHQLGFSDTELRSILERRLAVLRGGGKPERRLKDAGNKRKTP